MDKIKELDVVFVVGAMGRGVNREISRVSRQLKRTGNDCRVASIHFKFEYDSKLCKDVFYGRVLDFSNDVGRSKSSYELIQGNPLQLVTRLSFRDDATRICFLISNILPFNDSCEELTTYDDENGGNLNNDEDWGQTNVAESIPNTDATELPNNDSITDAAFIVASSTENKVNETGAAGESGLTAHSNSSETVLHAGNSKTNEDVNMENKPDAENPPSSAQVESINASNVTNSSGYDEDPLHTCRLLAAMGVVLYWIETNPYRTVYGEMYEALPDITGGQYINTSTSRLAKVIKYVIMEEVPLEMLVSYVRDYLCVAWLAWGRMNVKKPSTIEELSDNVLNYLHNVNIHTPELQVGGNSLKPPSKHAKKIAGLNNIGEARKMRMMEDNWAAELSWLTVEVCNEVIPGYDTEQSINQAKKVTMSGLQRVTRNQASRVLVRALARRPGMIKRKLQQTQTALKTGLPEIGQSIKNKTTCDDSNKECTENVTQEKKGLKDISAQEQLPLSCKQDILVIEDNCSRGQICVLV